MLSLRSRLPISLSIIRVVALIARPAVNHAFNWLISLTNLVLAQRQVSQGTWAIQRVGGHRCQAIAIDVELLQIHTPLEKTLLDQLDLVSGQIQETEVLQNMQFGGGEDWIQIVAQQIVRQSQFVQRILEAIECLLRYPSNEIVGQIQLLNGQFELTKSLRLEGLSIAYWLNYRNMILNEWKSNISTAYTYESNR